MTIQSAGLKYLFIGSKAAYFWRSRRESSSFSLSADGIPRGRDGAPARRGGARRSAHAGSLLTSDATAPGKGAQSSANNPRQLASVNCNERAAACIKPPVV